MNHCKEMHQVLNFSGVCTHHQNGWSDWYIRLLQVLAQYEMIHSYHQRTSEITANLWTYALLHTAAIIHKTSCHRLNYTSTHIHMFSKSNVDSNPNHWKPLFCSMYELACPLSSDQTFDKCKYIESYWVYI